MSFEILDRTASQECRIGDARGELYAVLHDNGDIFALIETDLEEVGPNGETIHASWVKLTHEQAAEFAHELLDLTRATADV